MKKILLTLSMTALLLFTAGCSCPFSDKTADSKPQMNTAAASTAEAAPDFSYKELGSGKTMRLSDLKGKPVFINFWATWCPPCQAELKRVQKEIIDRFKGKDFVFLPISREDSYEQIKKFREKNGYTFPMGMDTDRKIFEKFATSSIPRNYIVGKDGKIVYLEIGYDEASFKALIEKIEQLLK